MKKALSYSSSVRFEGMLRRVLPARAEEAQGDTHPTVNMDMEGVAAPATTHTAGRWIGGNDTQYLEAQLAAASACINLLLDLGQQTATGLEHKIRWLYAHQ